MRDKGKNDMAVSMVIATMFMLLGRTVAKSEYFMDTTLDCGYIGLQDIARYQSVMLHAKSEDTIRTTQTGCTINFQTLDNDATITVDFESFHINDCTVKLYISGDASGSMSSYSCGDNPSTYFSIGRTVTLTLHRISTESTEYEFKLKLTAVRDDRFPPPTDSNPIAVGLVLGVGGGIFGIIFIVSCVGICCFRKKRLGHQPFIFDHNSKIQLDETRSNTVSVGYTNESMRGSPTVKKKLLASSDSSEEKSDSTQNGRARKLNMRGNQGAVILPPPPPPVPKPDILMNTENKTNSWNNRRNEEKERGKHVGGDTSNNPMLNALQSNPKFRNSFKENERDADERAKRISSTSFDRFGEAPSPPSSQENISRPSLAPIPKSPKGKKSKHAAIGRIPRSSSFSSDELKQIEHGRSTDDRSTASSSELPPMRVQNEGNKKKADTTHSLRPDRKGPKGRKKPSQSVSSAFDPEPRTGRDRVASTDRALEGKPSPRNQKDRFLDANRDHNEPFEKMGSGRYSKRSTGRKSPRPGKGSGRGFSHRRGRSMDVLDSRANTPSLYGSMEDLDLPPLQRSSSKTSLYSSRSSLYDRRRRRKGSDRSYAGSVISYGIRDDMSVGRHSRGYDEEFYSDDEDLDGYEKPLTRRDRDRMYRSENDLGRRVREIATQTLRETATQTGADESVTFENKRLVKKKRRSNSVSSSGTQTAAKREKKAKTKSTERLDDIGIVKDKTSKAATKRSKSVPDFIGSEELEKPKIKPKPKPRKSTSADTHLDDNTKSASTENLADPNRNPYYPQSEGFVPPPYPPQQGYPMMVQPGYPGQPGMPAGYPYPMQGAPQGYPGCPVPPQQQPPTQMTQPQPPQNQAAPRQPRKSNWEMLCEMTDGDYKRDNMAETGSIASSVFTNNPASVQEYGAAYQPPNYSNHQLYPPVQTGTNQFRPSRPQQHSAGDHENAMRGVSPQDYENVNYGEVKSVPNVLQDDAVRKQSSWEQLQGRTEQRKPVNNARNESVV